MASKHVCSIPYPFKHIAGRTQVWFGWSVDLIGNTALMADGFERSTDLVGRLMWLLTDSIGRQILLVDKFDWSI